MSPSFEIRHSQRPPGAIQKSHIKEKKNYFSEFFFFFWVVTKVHVQTKKSKKNPYLPDNQIFLYLLFRKTTLDYLSRNLCKDYF